MKETMATYLGYRKHEFKNDIHDFEQIGENEPFRYDYGLTIVRLTVEDLEHLVDDGILTVDVEGGEFTVAVIVETSIHDKVGKKREGFHLPLERH